MHEILEIALRAALIGIGATMAMDLWAGLLKAAGIPSLDFALLGRWIGHLRDGKWTHERIAAAPPVRGELWLGWGFHYAIGIAFAGLMVWIHGLEWVRAPSLLPALVLGIATVIAPWFILQPALGAGIASRRTPAPVRNALKSLLGHAVFGVGLYLAAVAVTMFLP